MRTARKPSAVARELLKNFPKGGKKRRRRKKNKGTGAATDSNGSDPAGKAVDEKPADAVVEGPAADAADDHQPYSSDQHD
jgi:hypothetical protein